jgi:hypothetical protein
MKHLQATIFFLLTILITAAQKPTKFSGTDSINITAGNVWEFHTGLQPIFRAKVLTQDNNSNVSLTTTTSINGLNNFIGLNNGQVTGHENFSYARNIIIQNANGTFSAGADHTFYKGSNYATSLSGGQLGDANNNAGYAGFNTGFGNWNLNDHGFVSGQNNILGSFDKDPLKANFYQGGAVIGDNLRAQGNYTYSIGTNFSTTQTGVHFGIGADDFSILPNHTISINGVNYHWPTFYPTGVQSQLVNDGNGNLSWQPVTQTTATRFVYYTTEGKPIYVLKQ